jgi:putative membrane protein
MLKLLPILSLIILFTACSHRDKSPKVSKQKTEQINVQPITDAEIANALMTAETEGMNLSVLGREKASNLQVKAFAEKMLSDHSMHNDKITVLVQENQLTPKETKSSMEMKSSSETKVEELKALTGNEFDKAFMTTQIEMHEDLLKEIDNTLIPNAQNGELIAFLNTTRTTIDGHLKEARNINASLL